KAALMLFPTALLVRRTCPSEENRAVCSDHSIMEVLAGHRSARPAGARWRRTRLVLEALESRPLLTGNLTITGAHLVDSNDQPATALVVGEEISIEADWTFSGLSTSDQYTVRFTVDGVALDSARFNGQVGQDLLGHTNLRGWFAASGP